VHVQGGGDRAVAWVADRQLGLITTHQLHIAGIGRGAIGSRRSRRVLHVMFRGVYLVGHGTPPPHALEFAAVLAGGEPAFISHRSAAALWAMIRRPPPVVEVIVPGRNCRTRVGLIVHKPRQLDPRDRTTKFGIPVTSPARTVIDFAADAGRDEAEGAIAEACAMRLTDEQQILAAIDRAPTLAGVALVRAILGQPGGPKRTRSGGERAMLRLVRAARLPVPLTDHPVVGYEADFFWPEHRLIVEVDGYDVHSHRAAFERDHRRDTVHRDAGYEVLRFTGRQLEREPLYVVAVIARALDRRTRR
jgi:very-short-patch-repair endonuclease